MSNFKRGISLNKYISDSGYCSRREADLYIESGMVLLNGKEPLKTARVMPGDKVIVNGQKIKAKTAEKDIVIALFKPKGVNCTTDRKVKDNILDFIGYGKQLFPIGGLDRASEGMILLTNKRELVKDLLKHIENEYVVTVNRDITDEFIEGMAAGVKLGSGKIIRINNIVKRSKTEFSLTVTKEVNRQIRRMCQNFGYYVRSIVRVRITNVDLRNLQMGKWRYLTNDEIANIYQTEVVTTKDGAKKTSKKRIGKSRPRA